ncbi:hypothetical protein [Flavobacterium capsici]|uniref:Uncharacterized protein n=1 Tax=Flavobacterium capsici TaxID=3075618 RepID=A0AA96J3V9_9FLAO|nr:MULTISPECIES: hypothetical protein [unclassified Flavobacterium]WNM19813.1 hypothetical protein RN608_03815 [Flavobacterium sp. PMR2A8]WNM21202.1 hypothetical protein RN605_10985 [Flavobacterium sp. PMTSA4]
MKKLLLILIAFSLSYCSCKKKSVSKSSSFTIESPCPGDGNCSIKIEKNKNLEIKNDELGKIYYELKDNSSTSVIHYQYKRNVEEGLQDGQHIEEIIFEIDNNSKEINLENKYLQNTKMLFGRHCYCKGQAGYFKIDEGSLQLENKENTIHFNLTYKTDKVPQLSNNIIATIK